jgi:ubiquinone/menaquinone biosynthesis C-methylase UbiE
LKQPDAGVGQQGYWNKNLDPRNLGSEFDCSRFDWPSELIFYMTPDQQWALEWFGDLKGQRMLEVGAGIGTNALYVASHGATIVATDISADRLRALRSLAGRVLGPGAARVILVKCAAEALPFREGVFDVAYTKSVIIHTRIPEAAAELNRTMCTGGRGVFIEPLTGNPFVHVYRRTLAPKIWQHITTYFTGQEIAIIAKHFRDVETRVFYFLSFLAFAFQFAMRAPGLFRPTLRVLSAADRGLFRVFPSLKRKAWFVAIAVRK